jgi:hypothetical protein
MKPSIRELKSLKAEGVGIHVDIGASRKGGTTINKLVIHDASTYELAVVS